MFTDKPLLILVKRVNEFYLTQAIAMPHFIVNILGLPRPLLGLEFQLSAYQVLIFPFVSPYKIYIIQCSTQQRHYDNVNYRNIYHLLCTDR